LSAVPLDVSSYLSQPGLVSRGEHYGGAHAPEPKGNGLADAARSACDHRYLVAQWGCRIKLTLFFHPRLILSVTQCFCTLPFVYLSETATVSIILPQLIGKTLVFLNEA
jgi:hypothetical protein